MNIAMIDGRFLKITNIIDICKVNCPSTKGRFSIKYLNDNSCIIIQNFRYSDIVEMWIDGNDFVKE